MIDKVQKIRKEVARIQLYTQSEVLKQVLDYIDEVQKEEIPPKFPIISQKENPVCAFSTNRYTDEDRKVLCDGCDENCEYNKKKESSIPDIVDKHFDEMLGEEPAAEPIDFEQELYKAFGQVKDFTLGMRIAKWFYDMGKKYHEPVSIWHDANQQPTMYRKYLVRYSDGRVSGSWERHDDGVIPWKDVVKEHGFTHWCYVEDLLKL